MSQAVNFHRYKGYRGFFLCRGPSRFIWEVGRGGQGVEQEVKLQAQGLSLMCSISKSAQKARTERWQGVCDFSVTLVLIGNVALWK